MPEHSHAGTPINTSKTKQVIKGAGKVLSVSSHMAEAVLSPVATLGNVRRALVAEAFGEQVISHRR